MKWKDSAFCCGLVEIGQFGFKTPVPVLVEQIQACIKQTERNWDEPGKTLATFATTVTHQHEANEALRLTGFKEVGRSHGMHGKYEILMWFRPAD